MARLLKHAADPAAELPKALAHGLGPRLLRLVRARVLLLHVRALRRRRPRHRHPALHAVHGHHAPHRHGGPHAVALAALLHRGMLGSRERLHVKVVHVAGTLLLIMLLRLLLLALRSLEAGMRRWYGPAEDTARRSLGATGEMVCLQI